MTNSCPEKLYRKCSCRETAHDSRWCSERRGVVWACRNCGTLALDRRGEVRVYRSAPVAAAIEVAS